jgi:Ca-activated chloride channel family protein
MSKQTQSKVQRNRLVGLALALAIVLPLVAGCATPASEVIERIVTQEVERAVTQVVREVVRETVVVEGTPQTVEKEVTKVVEIEKEYVVARTATPAPSATGVPVLPVYGGEELPNDEEFDAMFFENYGVNPFIDTEDDHLSTFAMDVDTASYTVARRYVNEGHLPPKDAIRVEEFVNYFDQEYPGPEEGEGSFAIHLEGAPSPFGGERYYLVRVGIQGKRIHDEDRKDAVLTFVIDVSGSMDRENRLGLVKRSLRLLVEELRPADKVGIVVYGSSAWTVLEPTSARYEGQIMAAIDALQPSGSTYAEEGLRQGYEMAYRHFEKGTINRVILCSDGVANVGNTGADSILETIADYAERGITLSTVGFGLGNYNDVLMEKLADQGDGNYAYVDTLDEARRVFVENLTGTLQVIAKDAKIQVDFNPEMVSRYRLLGYENRDVADVDFRNDDVDAGEVGAGHSVTALYEIKFHKDVEGPEAMGRALTVYVRYQDPEGDDVQEVAREFWRDDLRASFEEASPHFQFTAAVAEYAEILRESYWAQDSSLEAVLSLAQRAGATLADDLDVAEFVWLVAQANRLAREG